MARIVWVRARMHTSSPVHMHTSSPVPGPHMQQSTETCPLFPHMPPSTGTLPPPPPPLSISAEYLAEVLLDEDEVEGAEPHQARRQAVRQVARRLRSVPLPQHRPQPRPRRRQVPAGKERNK